MRFEEKHLGRRLRQGKEAQNGALRLQLRYFAAGCAALIALVLLAPRVACASVTWDAAYDFATSLAEGTLFSGGGCTPGACSLLPAPNGASGAVNSSDWAVGVEATLTGLADGEVVSWQATKPDGSLVPMYSLTWSQSLNCFVGSDTQRHCGMNNIDFVSAITTNTCRCFKAIGSWSIGVYDNGALLYSNPITISHNPSSIVGITSPTDNELFQLTSANYNATGPVKFSGASGTGNSLSWTAQLHYLSSGGYGGPDPTALNFSGNSYSYPGYQAIGGQVLATASTTASDGSSVQDCVTFYVEGPESGILDITITGQLDSLYTGSQSYPTDPTGQYPPTPNLMTGVAERESAYHQFVYSDELAPGQNPDLFDLYKNFHIDAFFPTENLETKYAKPGQYIGLMQEPTTDPDAWDWTKNTADAVNLFSGTVSPNKMTLAADYATDIINGDPKARPAIDGYYGLSHPVGHQLENMALVLYGGYLVAACGQVPSESCRLTSEYYIPYCSGMQGTTTEKGQTYLTCSTGWQWSPNSVNQADGVAYVNYVMNHLQ